MRIVSTALTSTATLPPSAPPLAAVSSFRAVLADASTVGDAKSHSQNGAPGALRGETVRSNHNGEAATSDSVAPESGGANAVVGTGDGTWATADPEPIPAAGTLTDGGISPTGIAGSAVIQFPGDVTLFEGRSSAVVVVDPSCDAADIKGEGIPATESEAAQTPSKPDHLKADASLKAGSTQAAVDVSVVDPNTVPIVTTVSWQVVEHGETKDSPQTTASGSTGSGSALAHSTAILGTARTSVHLHEAIAANASEIVAGRELGVAPTVSANMPQGGIDVFVLPALDGNFQLPNSGYVGLPESKPFQTGVVPSSGPASVEAADGAGSATSAADGAVDDSSHPGGNLVQNPQGAQVDPLKNATGLVARATENGVTQAPVFSMNHAATPQNLTSAASYATHSAKAEILPVGANSLNGDAVPASGINSAKLIQTMGGTEMHVGMHSEEFGDISIRTSMSQQQMVAQISLSHNDLSQAISNHLSTVQTKLGEEYGLHASIEVNNQGAPLSGGQGDSSQRNHQSYGSSGGAKRIAPTEFSDSSPSMVALASAGSGHGLDIRV